MDTNEIAKLLGLKDVFDTAEEMKKTKINKLDLASQQKISSLAETTVRNREELAAYQNTWAGKLGLDRSGVLYQAINLPASFGYGASRQAGHLVTGAMNLPTSYVGNAEREAYNRKQEGKATSEDLKLLSTKRETNFATMNLDPLTLQPMAEPTYATVEELLNSELEQAVATKRVNEFFDVKSIRDDKDQQELRKDLTQNFDLGWNKVKGAFDKGSKASTWEKTKDVFSGLGTIAEDVKNAAVNNPMGVASYAFENAPQMLMGPATSALSNFGYANQEYSEGVLKRFEETGKLPTGDARNQMIMDGTKAFAIEYAGDMVTRKLSGLGPKKVIENIDDIVQPSFTTKIARTIGATGTAMVNEGLTEGYQTFLEKRLRNEEATAKEIFEGGMIGAFSAGGMTGAPRIVNDVFGASPEKQMEAKFKADKAADIQAAVASKDVTAFVDPTSDKYAPDTAIVALNALVNSKDITPEEKAAFVEQSNTIAQQVEDQKAVVGAKLNGVGMTPDQIAESQATITDYTNALATIPESETALTADINKQIELESLKIEAASYTPEQVEQLNKESTKLSRISDEVSSVRSQIAASVAPADVELNVDDAITGMASDRTNIPIVINLSMASRDSLSDMQVSQLEQLANDSTSAMNSEERAYFKVMASTRALENSLKNSKQVGEEILYGSKPNAKTYFKGTSQYREEIANALSTGSIALANKLIGTLENFAKDHANKARVYGKALARGQEQGKNVLITRYNGDWKIVPEGYKLEGKQKADSIVAALPKFQEKLTQEANLINNTLAEMKALIAAHGSNVISTNQNGVSNESQAIETKQTEAQGSESEQGTITNEVDALTSSEERGATAFKEGKLNTLPSDLVSDEEKAAFQKGWDNAAIVDWESTAQDALTNQPSNAPVESVVPMASEAVTESLNSPAEAIENTTPAFLQEEVTTETTEESVDPVLESGKLDYLTPDSPLGKLQVTQSQGNVKGSIRPLVAVKNFLNKWVNGEIDPAEYLTERSLDNLTEDQQNTLNSVRSILPGWVKAVTENFRFNDKAKNNFDDYTQFFIDENGISEENFATAIAFAAYSFTNMQANRPLTNKRSTVLDMFKEEVGVLTPKGEKLLNTLTNTKADTIETIGSLAYQALGFKVTDNTPSNVQAMIKSALGTHGLLLLERKGVIERINLKRKVIESLFDRTVFTEEGRVNTPPTKAQLAAREAVVEFVRMVAVKDKKKGWVLNSLAKSIKDNNVKSVDIVNRLFGTEQPGRTASTKPIKYTQVTAKRRTLGIPNLHRKVIEANHKVGRYVEPIINAVFRSLGMEAILRMAGYKDVEVDRVQAMNRDSVIAQNRNLELQLERFNEAVELVFNDEAGAAEFAYNKPLFVAQEVLGNQRAGYSTQDINQQTSKIARAALYHKEWETVVNINDMDQFFIAVANGIGLKIDNQNNAKTIQDLKTKLNTNVQLKAAIELLRKGFFDKNNTEDLFSNSGNVETVVQQVAEEGIMSLPYLLALARYKQAMKDGETSFTVNFPVGSDAKNSGPALTNFFLGAADYDRLNKTGFYSTDTGQPDHFSQYREQAGSMDLYEDFFSSVVSTMWAMAFKGEDFKTDDLKNMFVITGEFRDKNKKITSKGRNYAKTPTTGFNFGSSVQKAVQGMYEYFIEDISNTIGAIARGENKKVSLGTYLGAINNAIAFGNSKNSDLKASLVDTNMSIDAAMELVLDDNQLAALQLAFLITMGEPAKAAMYNYYSAFLERRNKLTATINSTFVIYDEARKALYKAKLKELVDSGEIAVKTYVNKEGEVVSTEDPVMDLSRAQLAEIDNTLKVMFPAVHSYMSALEKNPEAKVSLVKNGKVREESSPYKSKVQTKFTLTNAQGKDSKQLTSDGYVNGLVTPGSGGIPYIIHSSESSIMHLALSKILGALGVHDEGNSGLKDAVRMSQSLNQGAADVLLNFSPLTETENLLNNSLLNLAKLVHEGKIPKEVVESINEKLAEIAQRLDKENPITNGIAEMAYVTFSNTRTGEQSRLEVLSKLKSVDHYPLEGGQYSVPQANRDFAAKKLEEVNKRKKLSKRNKEVIRYLSDLIKDSEKEVFTSVVMTHKIANLVLRTNEYGMTKGEYATARDTLIKHNSGYAEVLSESFKDGVDALSKYLEKDITAAAKVVIALNREEIYQKTLIPTEENTGTSPVKHDQELVDFFEENKETTTTALKAKLKEMLTGKPGNEFTLALLDKLTTDVKVVYAEPGTPVLEDPLKPSRGWFVARNNEEAIYITSADQIHSGITPEVVVHEMLHANLAYLIKVYKSKKIEDPSYTSDTLKLIEDLESLFEQAKQHENFEEFSEDVNNLDEFISYGLTNKEFIDAVMMNITYETKVSGSNILMNQNGLQRFINLVLGFFFKNVDAAKEQGMTTLVTNVGALLQVVQNTNEYLSEGINMSMAAKRTRKIYNYNTEDIFYALGNSKHKGHKVSGEFVVHLTDILANVVNKVLTPSGSLGETLMKNQPIGPVNVWMKALNTGAAPFAYEASKTSLPISQQELFVMEQVEAVFEESNQLQETNGTLVIRELENVYNQAEKLLSAEDFLEDKVNPTAVDKARAQEYYDFLFKLVPDANGVSHHLSRFAGAVLGNEKINSVLSITGDFQDQGTSGLTFSQKVQRLFERALSFFTGVVTKSNQKDTLSNRTESLVKRLVEIEAKRKSSLLHQNKIEAAMTVPEDVTQKTVLGIKEALYKLSISPKIESSKLSAIRAAGQFGKLIAGDRVGAAIDGLTMLRDQFNEGKHGFAMQLVDTVKGPANWVQALLRNNKHLQNLKVTIKNQTAQNVLTSFVNEGKDLTDEAKGVISNVFLRLGTHHLFDKFGMSGIYELLTDQSKLNSEIKTLEDSLLQFDLVGTKYKTSEYFKLQAQGLAQYKLTNTSELKGGQLLNAHNIAFKAGSHIKGIMYAQSNQAIPIIESLIALYGLRFSTEKAIAASILKTEMDRVEGLNGVEVVLRYHKAFEKDSLETLFKNNPYSMIHGYTPEILNPYTTHTEAVIGSDEALTLLQQGYEQKGLVYSDKNDPNQAKKAMFVLRDGAPLPWVTTSTDLADNYSKGTSLFNGFTSVNNPIGLNNASELAKINQAKEAEIAAMHQGFTTPRKPDEAFLVPTINSRGQFADWRYTMNSKTRNDVLERDNRMEELLGVMASELFSKVNAKDQNDNVVSALKEDYNNYFTKIPSSFLKISPTSSDPELREIWALMPEAMKQAAIKEFGGRQIIIRNEFLTPIFGYRKKSLSNVFNKEQKNIAELAVSIAIEKILYTYARTKLGMTMVQADAYTKQAAIKVRRAENVWKTLVDITKDVIVIRTGFVLLDNVKSNISQLLIKGVSIKNVAKYHHIGSVSLRNWEEDSERLNLLKTNLASGYTQGKDAEMRREIIKLENSLARNPIKDLIEGGLMPAIVEDVGLEEDKYSQKTLFAKKADPYVSKIPVGIRNAVKVITMSRGTKLHNALTTATRYSDFLARYTMYQELTTRKNNPMIKADAIQEASESFVNYDLPMPAYLQYTDDMGITMFTKYFLQIQRVLFKMSKENPGRVLLAYSLGEYFNSTSIVTGASVFNHMFNNPFNTGALQLPGSIDEIGTVAAATAIVK